MDRSQSSAVEHIKYLIDYNLSDIKTISDLANRVNQSPENLRKVFLKQENVHLGRYIMTRKVQAMQELLLLTDDPCNYICYSVGLREDTGAKIFKKIMGVTMVQFRAKAKRRGRRSAEGGAGVME